MARKFKSKDEGKKVMTADGDMVGTVEELKSDKAYIKADTGLSQSTRRKLGWSKEGGTTYPLSHSNVDKIADDGIHLKRDF